MSDAAENQTSEQKARDVRTTTTTTEPVPRKTSIQAMAAKSRDILRKVHDSLSFGKKSSGAALASPVTSAGHVAASHFEKTSSKTELDTVAEAANGELDTNSQCGEGGNDQAEMTQVTSSAVSETSQHEASKRGTIQKTKMLGMKIYRDMKKGLGSKSKSKAEQEATQDSVEASQIEKSLSPEAGDLAKENVDEVQTEKPDLAKELPLEAETAGESQDTAVETKQNSQNIKSSSDLQDIDLQTSEKSEQIPKGLPDSEVNDSEKSPDIKPENILSPERDATVTSQLLAAEAPAKAQAHLEDPGAKESAEGTKVEPHRIEIRPRERASPSAKRFIRSIVENIGELSMDRATALEQSSHTTPSTELEEEESSVSVVKDILKDLF